MNTLTRGALQTTRLQALQLPESIATFKRVVEQELTRKKGTIRMAKMITDEELKARLLSLAERNGLTNKTLTKLFGMSGVGKYMRNASTTTLRRANKIIKRLDELK